MVSIMGIQLASKEENKTKKIILQILNIGIIIFLFVCMAISLNLPHTEVIKAKFFTFNNLYTAYYTSGWYLSLLIPYVITSVIMLMSLIVNVYIAQKEKNILLPIIFPIAISFSCFLAACTLVTNSGRLVPNATIVSDIIFSDTLSAFAIALALSTTKLLPATIPTSPINTNNNDLPILYGASSFSSLLFLAIDAK